MFYCQNTKLLSKADCSLLIDKTRSDSRQAEIKKIDTTRNAL